MAARAASRMRFSVNTVRDLHQGGFSGAEPGRARRLSYRRSIPPLRCAASRETTGGTADSAVPPELWPIDGREAHSPSTLGGGSFSLAFSSLSLSFFLSLSLF